MYVTKPIPVENLKKGEKEQRDKEYNEFLKQCVIVLMLTGSRLDNTLADTAQKIADDTFKVLR